MSVLKFHNSASLAQDPTVPYDLNEINLKSHVTLRESAEPLFAFPGIPGGLYFSKALPILSLASVEFLFSCCLLLRLLSTPPSLPGSLFIPHLPECHSLKAVDMADITECLRSQGRWMACTAGQNSKWNARETLPFLFLSG